MADGQFMLDPSGGLSLTPDGGAVRVQSDAADPCCPVGACCKPDGTCENMTREECEDSSVGGTFYPDDLCEDSGFECLAACCKPDGSCEDLTKEECEDSSVGGEWNEGHFCADSGFACPSACCKPDGSCEDLSEEECAAAGGVWYEGDHCDDSGFECEYACCKPDDTCEDMTASECAEADGAFLPGQFCADDPCVPICCDYTGDLLLTFSGICTEMFNDGCAHRLADVNGQYQLSTVIPTCAWIGTFAGSYGTLTAYTPVGYPTCGCIDPHTTSNYDKIVVSLYRSGAYWIIRLDLYRAGNLLDSTPFFCSVIATCLMSGTYQNEQPCNTLPGIAYGGSGGCPGLCPPLGCRFGDGSVTVEKV